MQKLEASETYTEMVKGLAQETLSRAFERYNEAGLPKRPLRCNESITRLLPGNDFAIIMTKINKVRYPAAMSLQDAFDATLQRALHGELISRHQTWKCKNLLREGKVTVDPNFIIPQTELSLILK